jgi:hypothetical protein
MPASSPTRASSAARPMTRMARRFPKTTCKGDGGRRGAVRRCRRTEMGRRALRGAPRGRPSASAQGHGAVRQSAAGDLLLGARRLLLAEAGTRRGPRHPDRARTDRRRLFRRAEGDHRSRQWPEARHRHAGLRHIRDRAHRRRRLRTGPHTVEQGLLDGKAQRHEVRRALEDVVAETHKAKYPMSN